MTRIPLLAICTAIVLFAADQVQADYDPLSLPETSRVQTHEMTVRDQSRDRDIPVLVYLPKDDEAAPVVLFSHGLGGSRSGCVYLGEHWSGRGYVAVFLQHPGSDDSVWKDTPLARRMAAMRKAASGENFRLRVQDVPVVLDQLEKWNNDTSHTLAGRLDLSRIGMSGHSFGAVTTQSVSGQSVPLIGPRFTDSRIDAALAFSPSSPRRGDPKRAFAAVKIPWMLMTGTKDASMIGDQTIESRQEVYPNLPETIDRYELVLHNAEHSAFSDRALPGDREQRNPNHHRAILTLSTAFWDAHLKDDVDARAWLHGAGARSVLEPHDRWQLRSAQQSE